MSLSVTQIFDAMVSHAESLGQFDKVETVEPKSAPGNGVHAALWVQAVDPVRSSGLISTSARVEIAIRIYLNMVQEPQEGIDKSLLEATDALMAAYSGDFELGGLVREVDLLGSYGVPLSARGGYIRQDSKLYRVMVLTVPLIVNDLWTQTP